jgi:hypothetical protein
VKLLNLSLAGITGLLGLCAVAHADVVSVTYPTAIDNNTCAKADTSFGWKAATPSVPCVITFPINVPFGKRVNQVGLIHGSNISNVQSGVSAGLYSVAISDPYNDAGPEFNFDSADSYQAYAPVVSNLMQQSGKTFPDAFVVASNRVYFVEVVVEYGATTGGLVVNYQ